MSNPRENDGQKLLDERMVILEAANDFGASLFGTEDRLDSSDAGAANMSENVTEMADTTIGSNVNANTCPEVPIDNKDQVADEAPKGAEASTQDALADRTVKPTITADHKAFKWDYYVKPDLPLCWQIQVHIALGTMVTYSDVPGIPESVREASLAKAERLLEEARSVYVHDPEDAKTLMSLALKIEDGLNGPGID
ncbi:hypothetical protein LTR95_008229 [Oleoguttula sp. CCFEE 5521]